MPVPDLFPEFLNRSLRKGGHLPVAFTAADIQDKTAEHFCSLRSMDHFRVELDGIEPAGRILHGRNRTVVSMGSDREALRQVCNIVCVAHPADGGILLITFDILQKQGRFFIYIDLRASVFADRSGFHAAPAAVCHELGPVTDSQNRNSEFEQLLRTGGGFFIIDTGGTAGQNNTFGSKLPDLINPHGVRMNLTINITFPDTPGDELLILSPEIQYDHKFSFHTCLQLLLF